MRQRAAVAVIVPCYNEEAAVAKVVGDLRRALPEATVYVYDNASTDGTAQADQADDEADEGLLEHGWRLRQDEPLPEAALEVIDNLASVGADCGAGTVHAAALDEDDRALSTYGVLLDDGITVGVAVDCETGVIRWASRAPEQT